MRALTIVRGVAAPLPVANVDTDAILPARFMKTLTRTGLGAKLFFDLRYDDDGRERAGFVLNRAPYRGAPILIAYENFGCGSSREHAPWALLDFGIRCVIAPSFGDIFATNCLKNGILPVVLPRAACEWLVAEAIAEAPIGVDLERERVTLSGGRAFAFSTDPFRRELLLAGKDDIDVTLERIDAIAAYEARIADW
jgi:3-isopropylmalate/(R)-2-methylmalate dehydratase small subunit